VKRPLVVALACAALLAVLLYPWWPSELPADLASRAIERKAESDRQAVRWDRMTAEERQKLEEQAAALRQALAAQAQ
jgi:hypothetical protein